MQKNLYNLIANDGTQNGDLYNKFVFYSVGVLRTYTASFIDMFKHIKVRRYKADFITIEKIIDVKPMFGSQSKEHYERVEDYTNEGGRQSYQQYPALTIVFTGLTPSTTRAKSPNAVRYLVSEDDARTIELADKILSDIEPTPYDYNFTIKIRTNRTEDLQQILEQILPYQRPSRFIRVKEIPFLNLERDINVKLESVSVNLSEEMTSEKNREHTAELSFILEGFQYSPITSPKLMKSIFAYVYENPSQEFDGGQGWLFAETEADIPPEAVDRQEYYGDAWLYKLIHLTEEA